MPLPLVSDLGVGRLALSVRNDLLRDLAERRHESCRLSRRPSLLNRIDALRDQTPVRARLRAGALEADLGVGTEALVMPHAVDLIAQNPLLAAGFCDDKVQPAS